MDDALIVAVVFLGLVFLTISMGGKAGVARLKASYSAAW